MTRNVFSINLIRRLLMIMLFVIGSIIVCAGMKSTVYAYEELVIVIDPGHGGPVGDGTDEANSGASYHDLMEKNITLETAKALKSELEQYGNVVVYLTREDDSEKSLQARVDYAKLLNADALISVHYNASADHNFFGSEIFTSAFGQCYASGYGIAKCIMKQWVSYGNVEKDIKTRIGNSGKDYYGIIRHGTEVDIPTIILEHGYIDNDKDFLRLNNELAWQQMGILDAKGIAEYYGLEKNTVKAEIVPTVNVEVPNDVVRPDDTEPTGVKLEIKDYDSEKGEVEFTLYAYDDESKLMYYGFEEKEAADIEAVKELELWTGNNGKLSGVYHVKPGYEGPLTAAVFNVYQLDGKSNTIELKISDYAKSEDESESASSDVDVTGETSDIDANANDNEISEFTVEGKDEEQVTKGEDKSFELGASGTTPKVRVKYDDRQSVVNTSYNKLLVAILIFAVIAAVGIVLVLYSVFRQYKRKRKEKSGERKSYDWIDYED